MTSNTCSQSSADNDTLASLHARVNAMLDTPVPKEGDDFPMPLEAALQSTDRFGESSKPAN